jgi:ABC-type Fe3+-hydroxamate transport system substrate-binding protein
MVRVRSAVAILLAAALVFAACSSDKKKTATSSASSSASAAPLTASFRGVTATTITVALPYVDFVCLNALPAIGVDFTQGDTEAITNAVVKSLNDAGGILGRSVVVKFHKICPIHQGETEAACTTMTDDEKVFAVIGTYDPPSGGTSGASQLCVVRDHQTILMPNLVEKSNIDQVPPGMIVSPNILKDRRAEALFVVLKSTHSLDGKKLAVLGDQTTADAAETLARTGTQSIGIQMGSTAKLTIEGTDTSAALAQLDSFIERWKSENVTALMMSGLLVSAQQFVERIKAAMPDLLLITDDTSTDEQAQHEVEAHVTPNPYEGMLTMSGLKDMQTFQRPGIQACNQAVQTATGQPVTPPDQVKKDADGITRKTYQGVNDACTSFFLLKLIAEKAGANLTNDTWMAAVNSLGSFSLPGNDFASLKQGKYDAEDGFNMSAFDSSIPPLGQFKPKTDLVDITK